MRTHIPLTVNEARAIVRLHDSHQIISDALDDQEKEAWLNIVESARERIRLWNSAKARIRRLGAKTYDKALRILLERGIPRHLAKDLLSADVYGMSASRFFNLSGAESARNLAEAYRPEGVP